MPVIIPIRDLRKTNELSEFVHKTKQPVFITKNGYSDMVIMSTEYYDRYVESERIDKAIYDAENEVTNGGELIPVDKAFELLDKKYYG